MALSTSARHSLIVFTGTLTSRILGFVRVILVGTTLGYTRLSDSYSLANETPNMMYELILGSLIASTMVPFFVQQFKRKDTNADHALMSFVFISAGALTLVSLALAPLLADFMTALNSSSSASAQKSLVLFFLLFFLPQIFFYAITAAMQAFLAARSRFTASAFAPIINNVVVIGTLLYVRSRSHELDVSLNKISSLPLVLFLAIGTTTGVVLITALITIDYIRAGGRLKIVSLRNQHVRALIARSKWMIAYAVANQIALFVIIAFANSYRGGVAMYLVAWSFFQLPHGLIANSIMTTMIPRITHTLIEDKNDINKISSTPDSATITKQTATGLTILMSCISAIGIAVAVPALILLISHGNISVDQGKHTARVLIAFLAFLPAFSLYLFCVRLANSFNKTKIVFYINVIQNLSNIILAILLRNHFTTVGLAFAFSLSYLLVIPLSVRITNKNLGGPLLDPLPTTIMIAASFIAAAFGYLVSINIENSYLATLTATGLCLFILVIGAFFVKKALLDLLSLVFNRSGTSRQSLVGD